MTRSQVSDWWEEFVYLRSRNSLMVNSNYYLMVRGEKGARSWGGSGAHKMWGLGSVTQITVLNSPFTLCWGQDLLFGGQGQT